MKKSIIAALSIAIGLAGCSTTPPQRTAEFEQADSNRNGEVSLAEWLRYGGAEASFLAADRGNDGHLDEESFRQALRLNDEARGGGAERRQQVLDEQIRGDVKRALEQSREINAWNIVVEVYQGNVTLSGPVRTLREKQVAEQVASGVTGVGTVFNQLAIRQ